MQLRMYLSYFESLTLSVYHLSCRWKGISTTCEGDCSSVCSIGLFCDSNSYLPIYMFRASAFIA